MNFESGKNQESLESYKPMELNFTCTPQDIEAGLGMPQIDQSELYSIPLIPVGAEDIVSIEHHDPTNMSIEERGKYVKKIFDAANAIKEDAGGDDRSYIMARWLQEALLVPKRIGKDSVGVKEVGQVLVSHGLTLGNVMVVIARGLKSRTGNAMVAGDDIEIIKLGMDSIV